MHMQKVSIFNIKLQLFSKYKINVEFIQNTCGFVACLASVVNVVLKILLAFYFHKLLFGEGKAKFIASMFMQS